MSTTTTAQEASNGGGDGRRPHARARRVLMFPLPFQGHINPMLQLADVLHGRGLAVTILHYTGFHNHNTLRPADGVPADVLASGNVIAMIVAMNTAMEASVAFRDVLAAESMLAGEGKPRAACLVIDSNLFGAQKAAEELGLPTIALRPGSAACFNCFLAYPMLHQNGYLPPKESQLDMPVKELPPLRVRDLFLSSRADHEMLSKFLAKATHAARSYSALVINTFEALETDELQKIRGEIGMCTTKRHGREEQQPQFADQMMNATYVDAVWGVGFELEGELERNKIAEVILKLLKGSKGEEAMRKRAGELKRKVASCLESGGLPCWPLRN
uniref:Cytokinin-N-glucosyltransferase 2 n=1 Tax=Aegilops tauschii TaxID=37682 RepID=M8CC55_AEGTA